MYKIRLLIITTKQNQKQKHCEYYEKLIVCKMIRLDYKIFFRQFKIIKITLI